MRYLLIPILLTLVIATIKKPENKCLKKCGDIGAIVYCW